MKNVKYLKIQVQSPFYQLKKSKQRFSPMEKILKEMKKRIVKSFLDIAIIVILKENENLNGYEIIYQMRKKFGILISAGTMYSTLYALERQQFIKGLKHSRSRTYKLASEGLAAIKEIHKMQMTFNLFIAQLHSKTEKIPPIQQ